MRINFVIVAAALCCLLVEPVLAENLQLAKVYRDYPGYINPAVCENPNVTTPPPAPAPQVIIVPLPPEPQTAAGPTAVSEPAAPAPVTTPAAVPASAPAAAPVAAPAPTPATPAVADVTAPATPAPAEVPAATPDPAVVAPSVASTPPVAAPAEAPALVAAEPCTPGCTWRCPSSGAQAPYLSLWAGMVATHDVDVDYRGYSGEAEIDNGFAGGVAVGYDFGKIRLELEGSYRNSNAEEGDADLKVRALMANVYADFETGGSATPYLGAGVGVAEVDVEGEDDDVFAGQVAAGILFAVTEQVAIDVGYRFMMTDDPTIAGAELELRQHTALLGVQIKF